MKTILLVDDDANFSKEMRAQFVEHGKYNLILASSGKEGVKLATTIKPDLILLDVDMPEMPGEDVYNAINDKTSDKTSPVIFLTALKDEYEPRTTKGELYFSKVRLARHLNELFAAIDELLPEM